MMTKNGSRTGFQYEYSLRLLGAFLVILMFSFCTREQSNLSNNQQETIAHFKDAIANNTDIQYPDSVFRMAIDILAVSDQIEDKSIVLFALLKAGFGMIESQQPDSALYYANTMETLAMQTDDKKSLSRAYHIMSLAYIQKNNYELAKSTIQKAIRIGQQIETNSEIEDHYANLGLLFEETGQHDSAIYYYQVAAQLYKNGNDAENLEIMYNNIGLVHTNTGNPNQAIQYFQKAISIDKALNDSSAMARIYNNTGLAYYEMDLYDTSALFYDSAIQINKIKGDKIRMMIATHNLANVLHKQGEYEQALKYNLYVLKQAEALDMAIGVIKSKTSIGSIYLSLEDYAKAWQYLNEALQAAVDNGIVEDRQRILLQLTQAAIGLNDSEKASQTLLRYKNTIDSLNTQTQQKTVADLEARYQLKEKDTRIKYMDRVNQSRTRLSYTLAALILLIAILAVFIILFYRSNIKNLSLRNERIQKENALKQLSLEKAAIQAKLKEEEADKLALSIKLKEEITGMIVHDLKNPLNNIINTPGDTPEQNIKLRQSGKKMLNMVNNILDVYKYEFAKMPVTLTENNLYNICVKAMGEVHYAATEKDIDIRNLVSPVFQVNADTEILIRILVNLLTNAVKHTPINGHIEIKAQPEGSGQAFIKCSISDTGSGIPAEMQQKVFEKFSQVESNTRQAHGSTGLGLTFCKMAVEAHGGSIGIDKNYSGGTSIFFTLPLLARGGEKPTDNLPEESASPRLTGTEKSAMSNFLPQLQSLEVYQITALRKLIRQMEAETGKNSDWLAELKNAVNFGNAHQYKLLTDQLKS